MVRINPLAIRNEWVDVPIYEIQRQWINGRWVNIRVQTGTERKPVAVDNTNLYPSLTPPYSVPADGPHRVRNVHRQMSRQSRIVNPDPPLPPLPPSTPPEPRQNNRSQSPVMPRKRMRPDVPVPQMSPAATAISAGIETLMHERQKRKCEVCRGEIPKDAKANKVTCSVRCRQVKSRQERRSKLAATAARK